MGFVLGLFFGCLFILFVCLGGFWGVGLGLFGLCLCLFVLWFELVVGWVGWVWL